MDTILFTRDISTLKDPVDRRTVELTLQGVDQSGGDAGALKALLQEQSDQIESGETELDNVKTELAEEESSRGQDQVEIEDLNAEVSRLRNTIKELQKELDEACEALNSKPQQEALR